METKKGFAENSSALDLELDLEKSLEQNASAYYEKSKQAKRKLAGLRRAMLDLEKKAARESKKPRAPKLAVKRKRAWFESFHWFKSSDGFLVIAGKDAKSNEAAVKKHLEEGDIFLHADIQGGSACIVKAEGKPIPESTLKEAASFAAVRSKAWQQRLASVDVYAVQKSQVSKSAPSGEAFGTGAFMIYGKRKWFRKTALEFAIGLLKEKEPLIPMAGPPSPVKKHCIAVFSIGFGKQKKSDVAKALLKRFEEKAGKGISLEEIISILPGEMLEINEGL